MEPIKVKPIDVSSLDAETQIVVALATEAEALTIKTPDGYALAGDLRSRIKGKLKTLEKMRKDITIPLDAAKKAVLALFDTPTSRLNIAVEKIDAAIIKYDADQEEFRRKEQERLDKEAAKKREKAQEKANEFAKKGNVAKSEEWQEKAETTVAPVVEVAAPKVAGQGIREVWRAKVVDFKALADEYKLPNQSMLDKYAQATKGKVPLAGVVFEVEKVVLGRAK